MHNNQYNVLVKVNLRACVFLMFIGLVRISIIYIISFQLLDRGGHWFQGLLFVQPAQASLDADARRTCTTISL